MMVDMRLSTNSRKALTVHLGEAAGREVGELIHRMAERIEELERSKVNVTPIVPLAANASSRGRRVQSA